MHDQIISRSTTDTEWNALTREGREARLTDPQDGQLSLAARVGRGADIIANIPREPWPDNGETVADAITNLLHWYADRDQAAAAGFGDKADSINSVLKMALDDFREERKEAAMPVFDIDVLSP